MIRLMVKHKDLKRPTTTNLNFFLVGLDPEGTENTEFVTNNFFNGWKVHIHEPHEFPEVARKGIIVGIGKEVSISLGAETTVADDNVKGMSAVKRNCLLASEVAVPDMYTMKLFHEYNKSSCLLECM